MGERLRKEVIILLILLGILFASGCAGDKNEAPNNTNATPADASRLIVSTTTIVPDSTNYTFYLLVECFYPFLCK